MTTANKITIFRMLMVPIFVLLLYLDFPGAGYWALGVFILASVTDTVDGYIARHYNQVSDFGKFLDPLADFAVKTYWVRYGLRKRLYQKGFVKRAEPRFRHGILGKKDSSTGYAQIFAYVAINAANFGADRGIATYNSLGICSDHRLSGENSDDLYMMWSLLSKDRKANIALASLNLISAAEEMNGHIDFDRYSEEEIKRTFTRYNANVRYITKYSKETYGYYLGYSGQTK